MRQVRWTSWLVGVALGAGLSVAGPALADVTSDRPAAILNFPYITVADPDTDTVIQLSNTSEQPVNLHCFYENSNSHCSNTGGFCDEASDCCVGGLCGVCVPGWNETDFRIRLTPLQPIGWLASEGLADFPIDGVLRTGVGGSSNAGSRIPPVAEDPFTGLLKCIVVDNNGNPIAANVVKGEATLASRAGGDPDIAEYNAVGIQAIAGAVNDDNVLVLGGDGAEYNGCPNVLIVNHFFDFAEDPITGETIQTRLVLVPCTQNLLRQEPGSAVVQYLVYNEFEQRFSTSRSVNCQQALLLSDIDTTQPERSIFSAGVSGTLTGQSRLTPIGSGLLGVAIEQHGDATLSTAAFNIHFQGDRGASDLITLP